MRSTPIVSIALLALFTGLFTPHIEAQTANSVVLNEIRVNPPGDNSGQQFIELYGSWQSAAPLWLVILDGDGAETGSVDFALPLSSIQNRNTGVTVVTGQNVPEDIDGHAVVISNAAFDNSASSPLEEGSLSVLLVTGADVSSIADFDTDNDSFIDPNLPQLTIVDAIGWTDGDTGDYIYGGVVLNIPHGAPDAATRFIGNKAVLTTAAWYFGDLSGNSYDPTSSSANLPGHTALTPGEDLVLPKIVINEVVMETWINEQSPSFSPYSYRYIELRSTQPHTSLQNVFLMVSDGLFAPEEIVNLSSYQTDENGLFLVGAPQVYQGLTYDNPHTSMPYTAGAMAAIWLSYNPATPPSVPSGKSWQEISGNFLNILQGGYLLDGLVINHNSGPVIEGVSIPLPNNDYSQRAYAATRFPGSMHPNTFANQSAEPDWYYGRLETFYAYDDTHHSANTPVNAMITPLAQNGRVHNGEPIISYFGFETDEMTLTEGDVVGLNFLVESSDQLLNIYKTTITSAVVTEESTATYNAPGADFGFDFYGRPPRPPQGVADFGTPSGSNAYTETTIRIAEDNIIEETETIVLEASIPASPNTAYGHRRLVIHILDNTQPPLPAPGVTISPTRLRIRAGRERAYTVVLDTQPYEDVFINLQPGQRCRVDSRRLTFTTENWNVPQRVRVRARNFPNTVCAVRHTSEGGGYPPIESDSTLADEGSYAHLNIANVRVQILP